MFTVFNLLLEAAVKLVDFAKSCGYWEFFSCENTKTLIVCLLDGADEVSYSKGLG